MPDKYKLPTFFKLVILFASGIFLSRIVPQLNEIFVLTTIVSLIIFCITTFFLQKHLLRQLVTSVSVIVMIVGLGNIHYPKQLKTRNSYHDNKSLTYSATVTTVLKRDSLKAIAELELKSLKEEGEWQEIEPKSKILATIKIKKENQNFSKGQQIIFKAKLNSIPPPYSPYKPNFKNYYAKKDIHYQTYLTTNNYVIINQKQNKLKNYLFGYINYLKTNLSIDKAGFLAAITINDRKILSKEILIKIRENGISHLIAISGLHIGILYGFLFYILRLFPRSKGWQKLLQSFILCGVLLTYGIICDWTPSISRSIIMFIFFECALLIGRKTSTLNSLSFAAFLILIITPKALFEVGFQLSFVGVFSILWFYPLINRLLASKYKIINYLSTLLSVTLSAQLGVSPLLFYYFDSVSINGMLLSVVLTPIIGLILILSLILLCSYKIVFVSKLLSTTLNLILGIFYGILDFSNSYLIKIKYSGITELELLLIFVILFFTTAFFTTKKLIIINRLTVLLIVITSVNFLNNQKKIKYESILFEKDGDIKFCTRLEKELLSAPIKTIIYRNEIIYFAANKCIVKKTKGLISKIKKPDILFVNQSISKIELKKIAPKQVLISSTMRYHEKRKLVLMLKLNNIPFHDYKKDGYLIL